MAGRHTSQSWTHRLIIISRWKRIAVFANLVLLCCVLSIPAVVLLNGQEDSDQPTACESPVSGTETRGEEATAQAAGSKRRYCYAEDRVRCLEQGKEVKVQENRTLCCGSLGSRLYAVMAEDLRTRIREDAGKGARLELIKRYIQRLQTVWSTVAERVAAHVGISTENITDSDQDVPRIYWEKEGARSFVSGGLIHRGDRLVVTTAGYYYVYSGLQFDVAPATSDGGSLVAYVYRHVNGTRSSQRKLVTGRESSCRDTRGAKPGPVSMHMAGIFLLREQDEISVLTYSKDLLTGSPATTYLGMHLV